MSNTPRFKHDDLCMFASAGLFAPRSCEGKACRIMRIRPQNDWTFPDVPEYDVLFLDSELRLFVFERELTLTEHCASSNSTEESNAGNPEV